MSLKLNDQHVHCRAFFDSAMGIFTSRAVEYAPEDVPLWDVFLNAVTEDVSILTVLRILTNKHLTAVRHLELTGRVAGPSIQERFRDIANFQALQSFYTSHQTELHATWQKHLALAFPCECDDDADINLQCQGCLSRRWLEKHQPYTPACLPHFEP